MPAPINPAPNTVNRCTLAVPVELDPEFEVSFEMCRCTVDKRLAAAILAETEALLDDDMIFVDLARREALSMLEFKCAVSG